MMGTVKRMTRQRCACGDSFALIVRGGVLVGRGVVGRRLVAERIGRPLRVPARDASDTRHGRPARARSRASVTSVRLPFRGAIAPSVVSVGRRGPRWGRGGLALCMNLHHLARRSLSSRWLTLEGLYYRTSRPRLGLTMGHKRKRTTGAADAPEPTGSGLVGTPEEAQALIRRTSTRRRAKVVYTEASLPEEDEQPGKAEEDAFDGALTELEDEPTEVTAFPKKKRQRRKKADEPVVYDIPPVETKETTFKGAP